MSRFGDRIRPHAVWVAVSLVTSLFATVGHAEASSNLGHIAPASFPIVNSQFAIADFDGDRNPDLATVELEPSGSQGSRVYSIRFRLTSGAAQVFGVTAPAGGLQIVAEDVNGDNALDLLVSTAWQHKAVAVLLNDGHGNFSFAKPELFPEAVQENGAQWSSGAIAFCEGGVLVRCERAAGELEGNHEVGHGKRQTKLTFSGDPPATRRVMRFSILGRAPPRFFHQT